MKYIAAIFSLFIFILTLSPCCVEKDDCADSKPAEYSGHHHDGDDSDNNACSPFYSCGTCSGFTDQGPGLEPAFIPMKKTTPDRIYSSNVSKGFAHLPVKPPRLI